MVFLIIVALTQGRFLLPWRWAYGFRPVQSLRQIFISLNAFCGFRFINAVIKRMGIFYPWYLVSLFVSVVDVHVVCLCFCYYFGFFSFYFVFFFKVGLKEPYSFPEFINELLTFFFLFLLANHCAFHSLYKIHSPSEFHF